MRLWAVLFAALLAACAAAPKPSPMQVTSTTERGDGFVIEHRQTTPALPAELVELSRYLLGSWDIEVSWDETPAYPAGSGSATQVTRLGPGGMSLLDDFESRMPFGTLQGHAITTWDSKREALVSYWTDNLRPGVEVSVGQKEGDRWVFVSETTDKAGNRTRSVMKDLLPDSFSFTMEQEKRPEADWRLTTTMRFRRRK